MKEENKLVLGCCGVALLNYGSYNQFSGSLTGIPLGKTE